ncbi:glutamine synthetase/guanido kinase [Mollisia scopiformis]|uniref:Glutamine synthetase n=1 Tax=Mollisia scopiformis TaxID=149040 RepID=A0A194XPV4_MOLSC|nr:glutamine synthetase/guanido kinase [Mollisia scopiformis]KUJ22223.1 glutamine synthetase/guanido kinase [Mollisia scopiformis]
METYEREQNAWLQEDGRLAEFLAANPTALFFRLMWIDYFGITRARMLPRSHLSDLQRSNSPLSVSPGALNAPYVPESGRLPRPGAAKVHPDWDSLRLCKFAPSHAQMICYISEEYDGSFFENDPRTILQKSIIRAESYNSRKVLVGFETEFFLLNPSTTLPTPIQNGNNCWSMAGLRGKHLAALEQMVRVLEQSGIPVQQFHTENTNGFFEIATSPMSPMEAVDALIYTHETIKTIAVAHGFQATVFPQPSDVEVFAGMHAHVSITPADDEDAFLAGMLQLLPEIMVLGMSNYDSHVRLRELSQTTGEWVSWGTEFRDVPVRKISSGHWEIRCIDGTANMYLVLGAILGAGCKGLEEKARLKWKDCQSSPGLMTEETRLDYGVATRLPKSMKDGLETLKNGADGLQKICSRGFIDKWTHFKGKEEEACSQMTKADRRAVFLTIY